MLANFVGYLRHTLAMLSQREVRLDAELELVQAYLAVIEVRMSGRLVVRIDVPASLHALLLPPLALATVVENAVKHGLTPAPEGGSFERCSSGYTALAFDCRAPGRTAFCPTNDCAQCLRPCNRRER